MSHVRFGDVGERRKIARERELSSTLGGTEHREGRASQDEIKIRQIEIRLEPGDPDNIGFLSL